ncbi:hypothetical protein LTR05_001319 [Lithohypha guttulata]|uniref:DUF1772-domain-containing protein n=1 Tax=Lithohypha guttulata TaxID=1690604 RepID=A0AAN7TDV7_9EURO|nr:hypothetical protein LTR05_001319 [Lithohypha guttulata]
MDRLSVRSTAQALGIGTAFLSSGIYFGSSYLAINSILPLPINQSTRVFSDLYHSGAGLMVPLVLSSTAFNGVAAYMIASQRGQLVTSIATAAALGSLAYTGLMMSNIKRLLEISNMGGSDIQGVTKTEVVDRLQTWKIQNYIRAGLAFTAGVLGFAVIFPGGLN